MVIVPPPGTSGKYSLPNPFTTQSTAMSSGIDVNAKLGLRHLTGIANSDPCSDGSAQVGIRDELLLIPPADSLPTYRSEEGVQAANGVTTAVE